MSKAVSKARAKEAKDTTPITLSQIPSLATLYDSHTLSPPNGATPFYPPSASLNSRVSVFRGDITVLQLDAIVNAANKEMLGGGGIDYAIHQAAGPDLMKECATHPEGPGGRCPTGEARITSGHNLPAKFVIHAVGPNYNNRYTTKDKEMARHELTRCYDNILKMAGENGIKTLAICGISTSIYGYPAMEACRVACERVHQHLEKDGGSLKRVVFVTFSPRDIEAYNAVLPRYFPPAV